MHLNLHKQKGLKDKNTKRFKHFVISEIRVWVTIMAAVKWGKLYIKREKRLRYDTMRFKLSDIWGFKQIPRGGKKTKYYTIIYLITMIQ